MQRKRLIIASRLIINDRRHYREIAFVSYSKLYRTLQDEQVKCVASMPRSPRYVTVIISHL